MLTRTRNTAATALLAIVLTAVVMASGSESPSFDLTWHTIDAGGGECSGVGSLELAGTIGQPDAGAVMIGGTFELVGGFWPVGSVQPACPADVNGDNTVNITDLLAVISGWGQTGNHPADVNGDNVVNIADLLAVISLWGMCP